MCGRVTASRLEGRRGHAVSHALIRRTCCTSLWEGSRDHFRAHLDVARCKVQLLRFACFVYPRAISLFIFLQLCACVVPWINYSVNTDVLSVAHPVILFRGNLRLRRSQAWD